ncbi:MAG TPA: tetratricopeptide repeat protein, partial [Chthoniobacterales bacterium]
DIADVVQIQNNISQAIVTQLKATLSPAEKAAIETKPTSDKEAYDLYLRARSLVYGSFGILGRQAQENAAKAVTLLESAVVRDPNFALAYCALAGAHMDLGEDDKAKQAIDNALRIAPNSADAHLVRAEYLFAHRDVSGQRDEETNRAAEKELAIAAAALPGRVHIVDLRADHEQEQSKWKEALADREKAAQLDPRDANTLEALVELYIMLRRYDQAERLVDHAIEITPQQSTGPFWRQKCSIALGRGDTKAAMAALDAYPMRTIGARFINHAAARVFMVQREYQKADEILKTVEETAKANKILPKNWTATDDLFVRGMTLEKRGRIAHFRGDSNQTREYFVEARADFEKWLAGDQPHNAWADAHSMMYTAEIDAALGRKEDALREGRRVVELYPLKRDALLGADLAALLSVVYLWSGEREAALQQLAEAAKLPTFGAAYKPMFNGLSAGDLKLNPIWDDLRNDPGFSRIIADARKPIDLDHWPNTSAKE